MRKLIQGTALLAVIVLVACEEATAPAPSIMGEWEITEALSWTYDEDGELVQADLTDTHDMTLTFTEDRWVWTYDPPLEMIGSTLTGSYEVLSDTRILLEPTEGDAVVLQYSMPDASTLVLKNKSTVNPDGHNVATAKRMR